ncbi:MAG: hypothetical protein HQM08_20875 [Candidatus Riflebacteria bacterium]|nr:hypothetical protein [Candidatus Riflebacteria bacterium]
MDLDFRKNAKLSVENCILIDEIADRYRQSFSSFIDGLSQDNITKIDWWISALPGKNTYATDLFENFCRIILVEELLRKGKVIEHVFVDSFFLEKIIKEVFKNYNKKIAIITSSKPLIKAIYYPLRRYFRFLFLAIFRFLVCRIFYPAKICKIKKVILIDTFILKDSFSSGEFKDRYYGEFEKYLSESEKKTFFFIPTILTSSLVPSISVEETLETIKKLRLSSKQFLLDEDFLKLEDYFYSFLFPFRFFRFFPKKFIFGGIDFSPLLKKVWWENLFSDNSIVGLLKYSFARKLKESGFEVTAVIDWHENQSLDRGLDAGFRKFFPSAKVIGYQGYIISRYFLGQIPSEMEVKAKVVPKSISVIGKHLLERKKDFPRGVELVVSPALRFPYIHEKVCKNAHETFTIFVPLSYQERSAFTVLDYLFIAKDFFTSRNKDLKLIIKAHPYGFYGNKFISFMELTGLNQIFLVTKDPVSEIFRNVDLVIADESNVCCEALANSLPVIIVGNSTGLTFNPIPSSIPGKFWKLVRSPDEMINSINFFYSLLGQEKQVFEEELSRLKNGFYEPVSQQNVRKFFGFGNPVS